MQWRGRRASTNVDDRRGRGGGFVGKRGAGLGCGGIVLVIVFSMITGQDPLQLLQMVGGMSGPPSASTNLPPGSSGPGEQPRDDAGQFASVVLADTEEVWVRLFDRMGQRYRMPTLVLFDDAVSSACGFNSAAVGPFYCPADAKVYIDLTFFNDLSRRFGAPGDFAQAYVIAHEVGHHVQNLLGISNQVHQQQQRLSRADANALSVRLELQADCLAGVWGHHVQRYLEDGDVEEGMRAAAAIGDDTIQRRSSGRVQPESWTHGSSDQRMTWLRRGLQSGDPNVCDTFGG